MTEARRERLNRLSGCGSTVRLSCESHDRAHLPFSWDGKASVSAGELFLADVLPTFLIDCSALKARDLRDLNFFEACVPDASFADPSPARMCSSCVGSLGRAGNTILSLVADFS
jgi:sulfur transfer protein SufE